MNNEDIVSLMERYKRELLEFEKRNTAPVSAQEKAEPEPVSAQQESQAEQVSAQVQEDAEPVNAPAAEPAKAVSAKAEENEAVSAAATVTIQRQTDAQRESQMQFDDGADTDKSQFTPERTQAAGRGDIPQPAHDIRRPADAQKQKSHLDEHPVRDAEVRRIQGRVQQARHPAR